MRTKSMTCSQIERSVVKLNQGQKKKDVFSNRTLLGRRLFNYEDTEFWFIDPVTLRTNPCNWSEENDKLIST